MMIYKSKFLEILTFVTVIIGCPGLMVSSISAAPTIEYVVTMDSPPDQSDHIDVNLTIQNNTEPDVYFLFCWYQNRNLKQNMTAAQSDRIISISANNLSGSDLPIELIDDPAVASQYGWEQATLWKVETGGASSFMVSYSRQFEADPQSGYDTIFFLVPLFTSLGQIRVSFQVPSGYKVIAPWEEESDNVFIVSDTIFRSWIGNLVHVDILCVPNNYIGPKRMVNGISVEFYGGSFSESNIRYSCDVIRYLRELHGGYEHGRCNLYPEVSDSEYITSYGSFNGGTFQLFTTSDAKYGTPFDWLMDAYSAGYDKFGRYNASPFHEFAHIWNVIVLRSVNNSGKWYHDGISNYFEAIGPRDLWGLQKVYEAQLYQSWDYYKVNIDSEINKSLYSLNPFQGDNYDNEISLMIFSKGMLFYYMLDKEFQLRGKNFSDFVKLLYSTFNSENPGTVDDFTALASSFAGDDLSSFMDSYLLGNDDYPLSELDAFKNSYEAVFLSGDGDGDGGGGGGGGGGCFINITVR